MRLFKKVAIVGTGLIGSSLALVIKREGLAKKIVGISRHKETLTLAKQRGIIDDGSQDLNIIKDADLVVLATPVSTIIKLAPRISRIISKEAIVTDVGSTKEEIVRHLSKVFPRFVATHPLAGSEKRGVANASARLFEKSLCIVGTLKHTDPQALQKIKQLWVKAGARIVVLDPKTHDAALSLISHLPHAIAFALINAVPGKFLKFAPNSLKDITRIAASDEQLWKDVFFTNKRNILKAIDIFEKQLDTIKHCLSRGDAKTLLHIFKHAKLKRQTLK